ncbi:hypothetical protein [Winogradskyella sp.]|uniref:hypothetical protein n=1 Tax=Winogradskyella sp. TaxID=1883156 RepID=UPI0026196B24|nr:hypothetical protein [Winogradskyella sp.]
MQGFKNILLLVIIFPLNLISQVLDNNDIKFDPLVKYFDLVQPDLVRYLDSVFSNTQQKKVSFLTTLEDLKNEKIISTKNDETLSFVVYRNEFQVFNSDNNYSLTESNELFFESLEDSNNVKNYWFNKNDFFILNNFVFEKDSNLKLNNSVVRNSILNASFLAREYYNSIIDGVYVSSSNENTGNDPIISNGAKPNNEGFRFQSCYIGDLDINGKKDFDLSMDNTKIDYLNISSVTSFNLRITNYDGSYDLFSDLESLGFEEAHNFGHKKSKSFISYDNNFEEFDLDDSFERVDIINSYAEGGLRINEMQDTLFINGTKDSEIYIYQETKVKKSKLFLENIDYSKLNTRWVGYELIKPYNAYNDDQLNATYQNLLAHFRKVGFAESEKILDIQYRDWLYTKDNKYLQNWIDKNWWNYGYNKMLIIRNTIIIFFFLSIINCFFLKKLSSNLYVNKNIEEIVKSNKNKNRLIRYIINFPSALFYTSQIFFGIRFDYKKLKYEDKLTGIGLFGLLYFFFMYFSGLVCVAYLVNVIVTI